MSTPDMASLQAGPAAFSRCTPLPHLNHVLACVDGPPFAPAVLSHAARFARAMGARITVLHVLESSATASAQEPMDPVEWSLRHYDTLEYLDKCLSYFGDLHCNAVIVAGLPSERIRAWAQDNAVDLVVLGRGGAEQLAFPALGDTARRVAEWAHASVLLVPMMHCDDSALGYAKLLVPLDGSSRAECALPLGLGIAAAEGAEVLLVHVAPHLELIESNLLNAQAIALREELDRHNAGAARQYLDWLVSRLPVPPIIGSRLLPSGDARRALAHTVIKEQADLMVLAASGKSGHPEMTVGSVADYLINRLSIPVLLVRSLAPVLPKDHGFAPQTLDTRLPGMKQQGLL